MFHHAVGGVEKKETNEHGPETHEVGSESRSDDHVDAKDDQYRSDQHAANACESCRFSDVTSATPQNGTQNTATVEWITRKEDENCEQQIAGAKKQQHAAHNRVAHHHGGKHQYKTYGSKEETCGWTSNGNTKLRARAFRFVPQPCETAKWMKHDLFDLDSFSTAHQRV